MEIRIAPDTDAVARLCAATVGRWLSDGGSLGLAGGSTPRPTYHELRDHPIPWERVTLWMTDERWVPLHHEDSNMAMALTAIGDHVDSDLLEVPEVGEADPHAAAAHYDAMLAEHVGHHPDVVMLGLGDDGHTASLFPGTDALDVVDRRFVATWVEATGTWRLTATFPYLCAARRVAFVVTGAAKADVVAQIAAGGSALPAARVAYEANDVTFFLDDTAASALP